MISLLYHLFSGRSRILVAKLDFSRVFETFILVISKARSRPDAGDSIAFAIQKASVDRYMIEN